MAENTTEYNGQSDDSQLASHSNHQFNEIDGMNQSADGIFPLKKRLKIHKILNGIDIFKDTSYFSDMLENPFNAEDHERINEIMKDDNKTDSSLLLKMDPDIAERIKTIDKLLEEMKAAGHAHKNIVSTKCKSKCTTTLKSLDELKAEIKQIDESINANKKNREEEKHNDNVIINGICE